MSSTATACQLLHGDCLALMPTLPDNSVDCILTDPPYFRVKGEAWDRQWSDADKFIAWLGRCCEQWHRLLKPNGSLYCFASPQMSSRVEVEIGRWFNVLNAARWVKDEGWHKKANKEAQRSFSSPWEAVIFAEHHGSDGIAKGEAGYDTKCDELRGFVFEPLRLYLAGERDRAGLTTRQVAEEYQKKSGSRTVTGMDGHWFDKVQWELPTPENYAWLQATINRLGRRPAPPFADFHAAPRDRFERSARADYEHLRADYEYLRADYEDLPRPFHVTADVPYTDVWTFPTVGHYPGKHPCEKPAALLRHILSVSTRPDAVVLDCFMGSGATGVVAAELGRQFIGIEQDDHWFDYASRRLSVIQPSLFA